MRKILSVFILSVMFTSCYQKQSDKNSYSVAVPNKEVASMEFNELVSMEYDEVVSMGFENQDNKLPKIEKIEKQESVEKKIIKDGRLELQVSELKKTKSRIDTLIKNRGGYYANESFNNSDWESSYSLSIRIPSATFEKLISDIESGDGEILFKKIEARDVTDQFIDLETRLETKKSYLKRYKDLLKQAKSVKEILDIEKQIRGLEEEIDSTTGRLKYLSSLVDFSTLDLTISKKKVFKYNPDNRDPFSESLKQSLSNGWFGFVDSMLVVIQLWPFWIVFSLLFYFWRKYKRTKK